MNANQDVMKIKIEEVSLFGASTLINSTLDCESELYREKFRFDPRTNRSE